MSITDPPAVVQMASFIADVAWVGDLHQRSLEQSRSGDVHRTVTGYHTEIRVERDSLRGCKMRLRHQPRHVLLENSAVILF